MSVTFIQAIILGAIQGITEFLPISSSAHLVLAPWIFGWNYEGLGFDTALHFGTAIAIVAFFWRDWLSIIAKAISHKKQEISNNSQTNSKSQIPNSNEANQASKAGPYPPNLLWQILLASIPAAIAGYLLSDYVETYLHSPILLAVNLAVFGVILWLVDILVKKNNLKLSAIKWGQSLIVGLAQCLALIPGVSRSGITITAARGLGLNRENAARFSFLLSTPATVGAFLFEARKVDWANTPSGFWLAIIVTVIVGLLTIKYLLQYLERGSFLIFTIYRVILAIIIIAIFLMR